LKIYYPYAIDSRYTRPSHIALSTARVRLICRQGPVSHPPSSSVKVQHSLSDSDTSSNPSDSPRCSWSHRHRGSHRCRRDSSSSSNDTSDSRSEDSGSDSEGHRRRGVDHRVLGEEGIEEGTVSLVFRRDSSWN
jgi:hypothetical protein